MSEVRLTASDPKYKKFNDAWESYARSMNPHCWFNLRDVSRVDLMYFQDELVKEMERLLR